jgi:lipid II:glycine glycyltransferase (peptidoglycan interpeptide bridge formation enzyme)
MIEYGKKRGWKYIELRGGEKYFSSLKPPTSNLASVSSRSAPDPSASNLERSDPRSSILVPQASNLGPLTSYPVPVFITYIGHTLDLTKGEERIYSGLRDSTRRNIKKATAQGIVAKISTNLEGIKEFYRLNCTTRRHHGLPSQPFHFFKKVHEYIISKKLGFVALASCQKRAIAGAVFFHFGKSAIYKYGASDRKYLDLRANNLIIWEGIRELCKHFYENLCLGRTETENKGLRQFKNGWGTKEYTINYFRYELQTMEFTIHQSRLDHLGTRLFQRMPIPVLNLAGSVLYRHIG